MRNNTAQEKIEQKKRDGWLRRNSILRNENLITKTLQSFNFEISFDFNITTNKCNLSIENGEISILLGYGLEAYKIQVNSFDMCYNLLKCYKNGSAQQDRYRLIHSYFGEDPLFKILCDITNGKHSDVSPNSNLSNDNIDLNKSGKLGTGSMN